MRSVVAALVVTMACTTACSPEPACVEALQGRDCPSSSIEEALGRAESAATYQQMQDNGDGLIARIDLLERGAISPANELLASGESGAAMMREKIRTGGADIDHALVVYAYVLGKMKDQASLPLLADMIELTSLGTDLDLAPHAATDAVFQILGNDGPRNDTALDYWIEHRDSAVAAARAGTVKSASSHGHKSCQLKYTLVDANRDPITYQVAGQTVEASFECTQRNGNYLLPPAQAQGRRDRVTKGGGTYVAAFDGGEPSQRYNCGGFSFRELTGGPSFKCNSNTMFKVFTRSGALVKKSGSPAVGDKVFFHRTEWALFFQGDISQLAAHVAVVQEAGGARVIVRGPDNDSGVFDAPIDAAYFNDSMYVADVYSWAGGSPPSVISAIKEGEDPRFCSDECANQCSDSEVCLDGACVDKTAQTSCELRTPMCCPGQDNSCTAPDALCFCDNHCVTANDCCPDACDTCGWCG